MEEKLLNRHERRRLRALQEKTVKRKKELPAFIALQKEQGRQLAHQNRLARVKANKEARLVAKAKNRETLMGVISALESQAPDGSTKDLKRAALIKYLRHKLNKKEY